MKNGGCRGPRDVAANPTVQHATDTWQDNTHVGDAWQVRCDPPTQRSRLRRTVALRRSGACYSACVSCAHTNERTRTHTRAFAHASLYGCVGTVYSTCSARTQVVDWLGPVGTRAQRCGCATLQHPVLRCNMLCCVAVRVAGCRRPASVPAYLLTCRMPAGTKMPLTCIE